MNQPVNQAVKHNRFEVTDGDRLRWQRQAAHALTALLQNAPVLPPLIWTIGPTGALVGHLAGLSPRNGCASVSRRGWPRWSCRSGRRSVPRAARCGIWPPRQCAVRSASG